MDDDGLCQLHERFHVDIFHDDVSRHASARFIVKRKITDC